MLEAGVRLLPFLLLGLLVMPTLSADLDADGDGEVTVQEFLKHQVFDRKISAQTNIEIE